MIDRLAQRIRAMVGAARSTTASQEGATQKVQVKFIGTANGGPQVSDGIASIQDYGFASATLPGCDYVVNFMSGDRASNRAIAVASNDQRYRPTGLQPGESMMYDNIGQSVYLSASGVRVVGVPSITLSAGGHSIFISSAGVVIDGYNFAMHKHTSETPGTPTSVPIAGT